MKIIESYSPNFDKKKRLSKFIKMIVFHYTGMQSERESLKRLCDPKFKVSCHFFINSKGKVYRLVPEQRIAWHAGKSCWRKYKNINNNSIGIELANKGHEFGYNNFKKKQLFSLIKICSKLIKKYRIKKINVVGHSDVAPSRKMDPGEKFPWEYLAEKNIGIWHSYKNDFLKKFRKIKIYKKSDKVKFVKNLKRIGYCFSPKNEFYFIKAFQRHFRKELVNGVLDKECFLIAQNIAKKALKMP